MPRLGAAHGVQGDAAIESSEAATVLHRERQQISVSDLIWSKDSIRIDPFAVAQREVVRPESVVGFTDLLG
jgi:hypothetical protein